MTTPSLSRHSRTFAGHKGTFQKLGLHSKKDFMEDSEPSKDYVQRKCSTGIDWDAIRKIPQVQTKPPVIYTEIGVREDSYVHFNKLSHRVCGCRYDLPDTNNIILAYAKNVESEEPPQVIGAITFAAADKSLRAPLQKENHMDDFYHKITFLFVDRSHQKQGLGSRLLREALQAMASTGIKRPVRVEGAKTAVKFFYKNGFTECGKKPMKCTARGGSRLFKELHYLQYSRLKI